MAKDGGEGYKYSGVGQQLEDIMCKITPRRGVGQICPIEL